MWSRRPRALAGRGIAGPGQVALIDGRANNRRPRLAGASPAHFLTVASVLIRARSSIGNRRAVAGPVGIARICRAGVAVVAVDRAGLAHAVEAHADGTAAVR